MSTTLNIVSSQIKVYSCYTKQSLWFLDSDIKYKSVFLLPPVWTAIKTKDNLNGTKTKQNWPDRNFLGRWTDTHTHTPRRHKHRPDRIFPLSQTMLFECSRTLRRTSFLFIVRVPVLDLDEEVTATWTPCWLSRGLRLPHRRYVMISRYVHLCGGVKARLSYK